MIFSVLKKHWGFWVFLVHPTVVSVLLSASVERCFVSRMWDFLTGRSFSNHLGVLGLQWVCHAAMPTGLLVVHQGDLDIPDPPPVPLANAPRHDDSHEAGRHQARPEVEELCGGDGGEAHEEAEQPADAGDGVNDGGVLVDTEDLCEGLVEEDGEEGGVLPGVGGQRLAELPGQGEGQGGVSHNLGWSKMYTFCTTPFTT